MILIQDNELAHSWYGKIFGQLTIVFWYSCMFAHIAVSLNRYISIVYPVKAMKLFTTENTKYALGVLWCCAFCVTIPYFFNETCYLAFNAHTFQWTYAATNCGQTLSHFDFVTGVIICSTTFIIDMMTLCSLRTVNNFQTIGSQTAAQASKRRKNEIRLFTQAFTQCIIFCVTLFSFHIFTLISNNLWWEFSMVTMVWISAHTLDGLIVILFHYRSLFTQKLRTLSSTTVVTVSQQKSSRSAVQE
ncbi:unnamed protein product [Caenorhabditis angaria]|uniref:G-protein coupled receptors family 1 profile domain-containing protein n=1 Tax=Caenorhabditis angaria TaxID=860376 RepID=A0A9P1IRL6_9PELO|nr:unnamed protein product [Caenorhabditis angaria]